MENETRQLEEGRSYTASEAVNVLFDGDPIKSAADGNVVAQSLVSSVRNGALIVSKYLDEHTEMVGVIQPDSIGTGGEALIWSDTDVTCRGVLLERGFYLLVLRDEDKARFPEADKVQPTPFSLMYKADIGDMDSEGFTINSVEDIKGEDGAMVAFGDYSLALAKKYASEEERLYLGIVETLINGTMPRTPEATQRQAAPKPEGITVTNHVAPISKPTQTLIQGNSKYLFQDGGSDLFVGGKKGTQTYIQFALSPEYPTLTTSQDIDAEDVAIISAVTSLKCEGNTVITPFQIAETMGYKRPNKELQEEIHARVEHLRSIVGRIDFSEQAKRWKLINPDTNKPFEHAEISGNLLSLIAFEGVDTDGNRYVRYEIAANPLTYEHARYVHEVANYDQSLLSLKPIDDVSGKPAKKVTRDQMKIARALVEYIAVLKNKKSTLSDSITYDQLFQRAGFTPGSDSSRKRAIRFVHGYLRALKDVGYIIGFEPIVEQSQRHRQTKVCVFVEKPKKRLKKSVE